MSFFALALTTVLPLLASEIKSDEVVVFYPSYARLDEDGRTWTIFVHGVVFEPQRSSLKRALAISVIRRYACADSGEPVAARNVTARKNALWSGLTIAARKAGVLNRSRTPDTSLSLRNVAASLR